MKIPRFHEVIFAIWAVLVQTPRADCPTLNAAYPAPVLADGWDAQLIAQNLTLPRSILFDSNGGLLVVQQGAGVVHLDFTDGGGRCLDVSKKTYLINSTSVGVVDLTQSLC